MKKLIGAVAAIFVVLAVLVGTSLFPFKTEQFVHIKPDEVLYLIPPEVEGQGTSVFQSVEDANKRLAPAFRVSLEQRTTPTGWMPWSYRYMTTQNPVIISRKPVMREWVAEPGRGSGTSNEGIYLESADGVKFHCGVVLVACIESAHTAQYAVSFGKRPLADVLDSTVRTYVAGKLAQHARTQALELLRAHKREMFDKTKGEVQEHFKQYGITILSMGLEQGLMYSNGAVQEVIDKEFTYRLQAEINQNLRKAQAVKNETEILKQKAVAEAAAAQTKAEKALAFQASVETIELQIKQIRASGEKFQGQLPRIVLPDGQNGAEMLLNLNPAAK